MYQQDYILRLIEQVGAVIRRMLHAIAEERPEHALDASDEAMGLVLDMEPRFVESLSGQSIVALLGAGGRLDSKRALALGEVFLRRAQARAAIPDEPEHIAAEAERARMLLMAVHDLGDAADTARADELLAELGDDH